MRTLSSSPRRALGLSLVEILVGVAIGMIGVVAIFQAVSIWTKHTQTTSSGGDAQVAGTLALFNLERDMKQAGHGFGRAVTPVMGCDVAATDTTPVRAFNFGLRPVEIAASAGGAPDQINVLYGNSSFYVEEGTFTNSTPTSKKLVRRGGFKPGDIAVAAFNPGASAATATCQLLEITGDANPDGLTIDHDSTVAYTSYYAASGAPAAMPRFDAASAPAFASGTLYNLGPRPIRFTWFVPDAPNNRILAKTDLIHPEVGLQQVAEGVINMKAEYGFDADGDGQISDTEWTATLPVGADWKRVYAIRVAILVRSRQFERGDPSAAALAVTPASPTYFGSTGPAKLFQMLNVDGSADSYGVTDVDPNNWRFYRYRVYERVIPLRNMLWGNFG